MSTELNSGIWKSSVLALAETVWNYHHLGHTLRRADLILVLGSHDTRVAERGADLFLDGLAPLIAFAGGLGRLTEGRWDRPEADIFAEIAIDRGVPSYCILIENQSTNTGENIIGTKALLAERGLDPQRILIVQKPYMERRAYATARVHWPEKELIITSPQIAFEDYPTEEIPLEEIIHIMVGDLQRIRLYPSRGFQIPQDIPDDVWSAYEKLVAFGFTQHLV